MVLCDGWSEFRAAVPNWLTDLKVKRVEIYALSRGCQLIREWFRHEKDLEINWGLGQGGN